MNKKIILGAVLLLGIGPVLYCWLFPCGSKHSNVMLVVLDTTRADHLGIYGHERNTSPRFDEFARENVLFNYAMTTSPWTPPSVATMITGLYPVSHGMMPPNSREKAIKVLHRLPEELETLAEFFKSKGYSTAGITPNPWTKEEFNYHQGYDTYRFDNRAIAGKITTQAIEMIEAMKKKGDPFFMYVHYLDPHDPYNPPEKFNTFQGELKSRKYDENTLRDINLYDGEISYMDASFGKLIDFLKEQNLYEDMKIVVVGDHGEQFRERGELGHGFMAHTEEVHVPLMVRTGERGRVVDFTVSTIDVFPTLIDLAGFPVPEYAQGLSLKNNENFRDRAGVLTEIRRKFNQKAFTSFEGKKVILDFGSVDYTAGALDQVQGVGLFDRHVDYREVKPIEDEEAKAALIKEYDSIYRSVATGEKHDSTVEVTDDTIKQLKSLGYLQ